MVVKLDEKACSLDADELVAFVRLSFNADKDGYVYGSNKGLSEKIGMSVAKTKKAIDGLFEKQMLSIGNGKVFIWKHEDNIEFAEGEESKQHKNEPERIALNNVPSVQQVDDKAKKVCEYFNKVNIFYMISISFDSAEDDLHITIGGDNFRDPSVLTVRLGVGLI